MSRSPGTAVVRLHSRQQAPAPGLRLLSIESCDPEALTLPGARDLFFQPCPRRLLARRIVSPGFPPSRLAPCVVPAICRVPTGTHKRIHTWSAAAGGQVISRFAPTVGRSGWSEPDSSQFPSRSRGGLPANWDEAPAWGQRHRAPGRTCRSVYVEHAERRRTIRVRDSARHCA
jgi:hypothetical protein